MATYAWRLAGSGDFAVPSNWTLDGTRLLMARGSITRDAVLLRDLIGGSR